ncbi:MAG: dockerin type I domain-containing protein [Betaproteobacteria bacterium]
MLSSLSRILFASCVVVASLLSPPAHAQPSYDMTSVAGGGMQLSGPALSVKLYNPINVAFAPDGAMLFVDGYRILRLDPASQIVTIIAGNPDITAPAGSSGDGGLATAATLAVEGIAVDTAGNIYIAESGGNRIRRIDHATGFIDTIAGNGTQGFSGDGGPAIDATFNTPRSVTLDATGGLLIADSSNARVRRIDLTTGMISTFAGGGAQSADGILATDAYICSVSIVRAAADGFVYLTGPFCVYIWRIDPATQIITRYTNYGSGLVGGMELDKDGNLLYLNVLDALVRRVDKTTKAVTTIAGGGNEGPPLSDFTAGLDAYLYAPRGMAIDAAGTMHFGGGNLQRVYRLDEVAFGLSKIDSMKPHESPGTTVNVAINRRVASGTMMSTEPRKIGAEHYLQFRFNGPVTSFGGISIVDELMTSVTGFTITQYDSRILVQMPPVADKKRLTIRLTGVNGGPDIVTSVGFLLGDVNGDGMVDGADVIAAKLYSGQRTDTAARYDITLSGIASAADIAAVKARMGNALP